MPAPPNTFRHRWIDAVYASKLTAAERDTLNAYGRFMDSRGRIQVQRQTIVEMTMRHPRWVQRHVAAAIRAGLLQVNEPEAPGRPTTYLATLDGGR